MTLHYPHELDALPKGARLRFVGSGVEITKTLGDLWTVQNTKGVWMSEELCSNRNPLEAID